MSQYKCMRYHISLTSDEIIEHYKLCGIVTPDGWVYMEIRKGMYGLKQAGNALRRISPHLDTPQLCAHPLYGATPIERWNHRKMEALQLSLGLGWIARAT
jgi:hypothetical protein